ncbi:MAG: hypothetical protein Q4G04_02565 [bacterium]|nr:hypothetical protein [bacterium]
MKKIGLLIPKTNLTVEYELQYLFNKGFYDYNNICFYVAKLDYKTSYKDNKEQFLKDLANDVEQKIEDLKYLNVDSFAFFCTSSAIKNEKVSKYLTPAETIIKVSKDKNIKNCLLITPYNDKIGHDVANYLMNNNIVVKKEINLDLLHTKDYFEYGKNKLEKLIVENYKDEYENVIISCTNLPTLEAIESIKKKININIVSSNSSMFEIIKEIGGNND